MGAGHWFESNPVFFPILGVIQHNKLALFITHIREKRYLMTTNTIIANLLSDTVQNGSEHSKGRALKVIADSFRSGLINGNAGLATALGSAPAAAPVAPVAPSVQYRDLGSDERIKEGDEWKLRNGLRSRLHPERLNWQRVTTSVGDRPSHYPQSVFRRKVA